MKKIYFTFLMMLPFIGFAQNYNVTLSVNAENITVGPNGVYAGGGFLGGSDAYAMDDSDSDDVWVVTLSLDPTTANGGHQPETICRPLNEEVPHGQRR